MSSPISHHQAIIYLMVLVSAADAEMTDSEFEAIGDVVRKFPVFRDFDAGRLVTVAEECGDLINEMDLDSILGLIASSIPEKLAETAYAAAIEVAAADDRVDQEELRLLELSRHKLKIDRLSAAAIERSARARHAYI